jgi:glycerol-3-phosphate O-acyltransferase
MSEPILHTSVLDQKPRFFLNWFLYKLFRRVELDESMSKELRLMQRQGTVIYAMKYSAILDYLLYHYRFRKARVPYPKIGFDMNMALFLPFSQLLRILKFRVAYFLRHGEGHNPYRTGELGRAVQSGTVSLISLVDPKGFTRSFVYAGKDALHFLLETQSKSERPFYVVPLLVLYKHVPEKEMAGLTDIFFGYKDKPGLVRKIGVFLRYGRKAFIDFGRPLDLKTYLDRQPANRPLEEVTADVRQMLIDSIDAQKRVILGPIMKSRQQLKEKVLTNPDVTQLISAMAGEKGGRPTQLRKKAGDYFDEMAADFNPAYAQFFHSTLTRLWRRIFDGIDVDAAGLSLVRDRARKGPLVFVPSHKSHIDYLILNYVLYAHHMHVPRIAAGKNLAFWPMGHIFRKSGAFFVRRSFKGAKLYAEIFETYIKVLLEEGYSIEFYIEGGRSRSGKLILPKIGFLSILLKAFLEKYCQDLIFVPVSISYDRILEEKSLLKEVGGGEKEAESFRHILNARRFLNRKYGKIYIRFGEPVSFAAYSEEKSAREKGIETDLAFELVRSINRVTLVTPLAVVSSAILSKHRRGFTLQELEHSVEDLLHFLKHHEIPLAATLSHPEDTIPETLTLLINRKVATSLEEVGGSATFYHVEEEKRPELEYYKNSVIHYFICHAFVAASLLTGTEEVKSREAVTRDYELLKDLFKYEFVYEEQGEKEEEVAAAMEYFVDVDYLKRDHPENGFRLTPRGFDGLPLWAGLAKTFMESYWAAITFYLQHKKQRKRRADLVKDIHELGQRLYRRGLMDHRESLSRLTFENAHQYIIRDVLRSRHVTEEGRRESTDTLAHLQRRLYELSHYRT